MQTDVVIVGKGIAAMVLSFLLKQKGVDHILIDRKAKVKPLGLAETLPPSALPLLHKLGLYNLFEKNSTRKTYGYHSLWGSDRRIDHNFYFHHPFKHGLKINKYALLNELKEINQSPGFDFEKQFELQKIEQGFKVTFKQDEVEKTIQAKIIIDATGRSRAVLKMLEIPNLDFDKNLAFTCHLPKKKHPDLKHDVFVESFNHGWGLVSGLGEAQNVVSIFTHQKSPVFKTVSSFENWKNILSETKYLKHHLSDDNSFKVVGKLANSSMPEKVAGTDWLAIGDAALAFDPLCSHGISNAIYTAMIASKAIFDKLNHDDQKEMQNYNKKLRDIFNAYLISKDKIYQQETRWKDMPFWKGIKIENRMTFI